MKKSIFVLLFSFASMFCIAQKGYVLKADAQGYLIVNGGYKPGDTLFLQGYFKAVAIYNLAGTAVTPVYVTNLPGQVLTIGDSLWNGGSWSHGLMFRGSHYVKVFGSELGNFLIVGSKMDPARTAYFDLGITELSDNFEVCNIKISHGGLGVFAKSEVVKGNPNTYGEGKYLYNFSFHNLDITDTYNEAMYIGHTATYWNINTNAPLYPAPGATVDTSINKRPLKLYGVKIYANYIHGIYNDGCQTAAIEGLQINANEITDWGKKHEAGQCGGLLIGGRVTNFAAYNNYVHDGYGDIMQVFADSGQADIYNNLLVRTASGEGVQVRGGKGFLMNFHNNTVSQPAANCIRINGYYGGTGLNIVTKNLLLQPTYTGPVYPKYFIYLENGGRVTDTDNKKYSTVTEANVDVNNFYQPISGSPATGYGYVKPTTCKCP